MDFADIKRKAEAAREFSHSIGAKQFRLRVPTKHELEVEAARCGNFGEQRDPAMPVRLARQLVERAVIWWSGVSCEDLAPGGGADAADLSPAAVGLLMDADPAVADSLISAFVDERRRRVEAQEAAAKN